MCARQKRQCKLTPAIFPAADAPVPPEWLQWEDLDWMAHRGAWFEELDSLLNIENYLSNFFHTDAQLQQAEIQAASFSQDVGFERMFANEQEAQSWQHRVRQWVENLRKDLIDDSVPSPGSTEKRWLLFKSSSLSIDGSIGDISCFLCKRCCQHLRKRTPSMPPEARASGMWRGPDPEELRSLSYCEAKVINLARVYVSVKRVFLDRSSYAGTKKSEAPLYHQKNVVAYPQNPDAALHSIGMSPLSLAKMLIVQFVGNRQALRSNQDLSVSVNKLRNAFRWLSVNSWPFMWATKHHELWETNLLESSLEELLQAYERSVGSVSGGVPSEILQGACQIPEIEFGVQSRGPANCTDEVGDEEDKHNTGDDAADSGNNCAAVLDGGVDDVTPVQLWAAVMRKYKVAQTCEK